ncbi:MAG: SDR family NAD(P)-dependent oxidoreductase [Acidovorax sp.]
MDIKPHQIAVITGGGTGMGRALAVQLSAAGVHVSLCDVSETAMAETLALCRASAPAGTRLHSFRADVSREADLLAFRDAVLAAHGTRHIHLMFNNAGIGGAGSFIEDDRAAWERVFAVNWFGVYYGTRAFLPLLIASPEEACLVNTSSVNGFWASLGPGTTQTAYGAAKFAVKGFTEGLISDLRLNAPHVRCAVVMPGHISTQIAQNTQAAADWTPERLAKARRQLLRVGAPVADLDDAALMDFLRQRADEFRDNAPTSAEQAAAIILDGVKAGHWRILVGQDAQLLDRCVRQDPENAYEPAFAQMLADARAQAQAGQN